MIPKRIYRSDFFFIGISLLMIIVSFSFMPFGFAETIIYSNAYPVWYSYDCTDSTPSTWTLEPDSPANIWKYYGYYFNGNCYATLLTFDFTDLIDLENTTSVNYYADTRSLILNNVTVTNENQINCQLYYFGKVDPTSDLSISPAAIASSYDCTEDAGEIIQALIPFNAANNATLTAAIQAGNFSQSFMLFPDFSNSTLRTTLDASGYDLAITKHKASLGIIGDGFDCATIEASNWCNFFDTPWTAIKKTLGYDYIGDWFYVFVFMPLPFAVFLISRNGAYAGFVCLPILIFINTIDQVVFEISLSLIALASAFGFFEVLRKKLIE